MLEWFREQVHAAGDHSKPNCVVTKTASRNKLNRRGVIESARTCPADTAFRRTEDRCRTSRGGKRRMNIQGGITNIQQRQRVTDDVRDEK